MTAKPFMPLWVADFVGDTLDLEAKEIGAYMLILMTMWGRDGYLPNDQKKLQRVARCGRDWPRVWGAIQKYFTVEGDQITQGRLLKEYKKVASKVAVNSQSGARGGLAKALKYKEAALANATVSPWQPEPYPERETDPAVVSARGAEKTDRELILQAIGVDPVSGLTGRGGRMIGTQADMAEAGRWLELPGITVPVIIEEITRIMGSKRDGPPNGFRYFTSAIQKLSGELTSPKIHQITPTQGQRHAKPPSANAAFGAEINRLADELSAGTITLDNSRSDPFAARCRGNA